MNRDDGQVREQDLKVNQLISRLYKRSTLAPVKTEQGNECILVDMSDCSNNFQKDGEAFFAGSDHFRILIRGLDYYVEVLNGVSFTDAYNKSML